MRTSPLPRSRLGIIRALPCLTVLAACDADPVDDLGEQDVLFHHADSTGGDEDLALEDLEVNAEFVCGDGVATGEEVCDGLDLRGEDCASMGLGSGGLRCRPDCYGFVYDACHQEPAPDVAPSPECGNGACEPGEVCDGADFNGKTCKTFGFAAGEVACNPDCTIELAACSDPLPV